MISGPRYMFLSIDDGNNNVGSNFTAIFAESTLGEHVGHALTYLQQWIVQVFISVQVTLVYQIN